MIWLVQTNLIYYARNYIKKNYPEEDFDKEMNKYMEGDYEYHSHYLIEKWTNSIDELVGNSIQGTFYELSDYDLDLPWLQGIWLDDIFERGILDNNIILK